MASSKSGSEFERKISKDLSLWFSNGENDNIFYRTQGSGSRWTSRKKQNKETINQEGDITYCDISGKPLIDKFVFSLKKGYCIKTKTLSGIKQRNWDTLDLIDSKQKKPLIKDFWLEIYNLGKEVNKNPVLIFSRNNKDRVICFDLSLFNSFLSNEKIKTITTIHLNFVEKEYNYKIVVMNLNDFLFNINKNDLI